MFYSSRISPLSCSQYLVSTVKQFDLLVTPPSNPGPKARTRVGSHPSTTNTLKGLFSMGAPSYTTSIICIPAYEQRQLVWCHAFCLCPQSRQMCFCFCLFAFNYRSVSFPFRETNICLFIKYAIWSTDAPMNIQDITSVPYSLYCYNIILTEHSQ